MVVSSTDGSSGSCSWHKWKFSKDFLLLLSHISEKNSAFYPTTVILFSGFKCNSRVVVNDPQVALITLKLPYS